MLKKIQKEVEDLRVKVYSGQSNEDTEKALYEIEQLLFKAMDEQLILSGVGKCPNLTSVWNEAVVKQENNEHNLFVTNECWGALRLLEKNGLCKINKY
jgi:hypothetical protein